MLKKNTILPQVLKIGLCHKGKQIKFIKMKTTKVVLGLGFAMLTFASCQEEVTGTIVADQLKSVTSENISPAHVFTTSSDDLIQSDIDGLLLMREEEKMARDVYDYFFETYGLQVFDRISNSENRHMTSVLTLIEYFGLSDPAQEQAGVFTNPEIQELYNQLIESGNTVENALSTGAYIEEYDIADLEEILKTTTNEDITMVYTNLLKGSWNHLRAFTNTLLSYGITYEPKILSAEEYAIILAESGKKGQGNKGNRQGVNGVDADGDGLCDVTGQPINQDQGINSQSGKNGGKGNRAGNGNGKGKN